MPCSIREGSQAGHQTEWIFLPLSMVYNVLSSIASKLVSRILTELFYSIHTLLVTQYLCGREESLQFPTLPSSWSHSQDALFLTGDVCITASFSSIVHEDTFQMEQSLEHKIQNYFSTTKKILYTLRMRKICLWMKSRRNKAKYG